MNWRFESLNLTENKPPGDSETIKKTTQAKCIENLEISKNRIKRSLGISTPYQVQ